MLLGEALYLCLNKVISYQLRSYQHSLAQVSAQDKKISLFHSDSAGGNVSAQNGS